MLKSRLGNNKFNFTHPGEHFRKNYVRQFDDNGCPFLVEVGETDIREEINMWRDTVDINRIIDACTHGNANLANSLDISAVANILNANGLNRPGMYGDFSGSPDSLIEAYNTIKCAEIGYNSLEGEFKAKYKDFADYLVNGDYSEFLDAFRASKLDKEVSTDA